MNSNSTFPCRFAFRKEYFGGLLLDFNNADHELIDPEEFQFLEKLDHGESFFLRDLKDSGYLLSSIFEYLLFAAIKFLIIFIKVLLKTIK